MRIIFACPFPRDQIAGGIRTTYRHAEMLLGAGVDAAIFSPDGHPGWFRSSAKVLTGPGLSVAPTDVVVVNEILDDVLMKFLGLACRRQMFCQNQFYSFGRNLGLRDHAQLGLDGVYCASESIRDFYARIYGYDDLDVIPYAVDGALFRPAPKRFQIAYVPRKLPLEAEFIRSAVQRKFPAWRHVAWVAIHDKSEEETARIMGESAAFLALGHRDSFGLPAVEAMSAGCAVVGFHGGGGQEFATPDNGRWFHPDQLLDCVDAVGDMLAALDRNDDAILRQIQNGRVTATRYTSERTLGALLRHFRVEGPQP